MAERNTTEPSAGSTGSAAGASGKAASAGAPTKRRLGPPVFALSLMLVSGGLCWVLYGGETVLHILTEDWELMVNVLPRMALGVLVYGLLTVLVPRDWVAKHMGRDAGWKGLAIGTLAGAITPGGPWVIYPIAAMLLRFGAEVGAVVAFMVAWSVIGMNRFLVWEVSFLGEELAGMRLLAVLPLPILAGLVVRWVWDEGRWPRVSRE